MEDKYNHTKVEEGKYEMWIKSKCFEAGDKSKEPFTIVIPPPNITGILHLGHAWDTALQDVIIRYKKMCGYDTLWLPGMDHAAIATESKVVQKLKKEGINKYELGREGFLKECWKWKDEHSHIIHEQWAKLGLSLDYSRERFTLDEGLNKAVTEVFVNYYNKGIIYRGEKIINWDPEAKTALSNEEVIYKDVTGAFYHIKYFIENSNEYLEVATTRPETLFGDTAVAVNPNDERYNKLIGKNVILPIVNKLIPIIGDEHADPSFGTGIVKITPAHDPNDFEVGNRHNLERIKCINEDGTMNENAFKYNKMDRFECRDKLIKELEKDNLLISIEPITHSVGHSERTGVMVEPYLSLQWFVDMSKLSKQVLDTQKNKDKKVNFIPLRFEKILNHWMEDCHDWCISRQLWWGHRIPAWYKDNQIYVGINPPKEEGWIQDEDVLDTWFSSALWPFSTLGWPNNTEDLKRYYPNNVLVTAYDIIFFWVARMVFQGIEIQKEVPFKECLIHGLIRAKDGRKMSKSLGNGIDPMDMIDKYGCDALRYYLCTSSAPGLDLRFDEEKVASTWNFINKIWNASRFVLLKVKEFDVNNYSLDNLKDEDKWILTKLNETIKSVKKYMNKYEFNNVNSILYNFIWNDFCDNYIEMSKFSNDDSTSSVLIYTLSCILKMLHPFMPYVTEEIWKDVPIKDNNILLLSEYPNYDKKHVYDNEKNEINNMIEYITLFRNRKLELGIPKEYKVVTNINNKLLIKMLKLEDKIINEGNGISIELYNYKTMIIYNDEKHKEEQLENNKKEYELLLKSIDRRKQLLSNENYVSKAPQKIVDSEKDSLLKEEERLNILKNLI